MLEEALTMDNSTQLLDDPALAGRLIESLDKGLVIVDSQGHFRIWNSANTELLGKGFRPGLEPAEWAVYYGLHCPIERRLLRLEELPLARAMHLRQPVEQDLMVSHEGLTEDRWIRVIARPLVDAEGRLLGGLAITRNLTEENLSALSAQMMAQLFQNGDDAIFGVNLQGTVLLWSPGAERLFGWTSEEMVGTSAFDWCPQIAIGK